MADQNSDQAALSLVKQESRALAHSSPSPLDMLQAMIEKGVTTENAAAFEQLVKLSEHMEDRKAEREFAQAFNALQSEMKAVKAMKPVPNSDGSIRYRFAPYEEIMKQVGPLLERHHFTVSFSTKFEEARLIKVCTLQHIGGHSRSNEFAVRVGKGPPGSSDAQADGAASTYAKRFALCDILNIQIETDSDARIEGTTITPEQAAELKQRLKHVEGDEKAFLKFAGSQTFDGISSANLAMLEEFLAKKERLYMQKFEGKK